jgi:hypothetical protein
VWLRAEQQVGDNDGGSWSRKMGCIQGEFSASLAQQKAVASEVPGQQISPMALSLPLSNVEGVSSKRLNRCARLEDMMNDSITQALANLFHGEN